MEVYFGSHYRGNKKPGEKLECMGFSGTGWQPCVPEENDAFGEEWMEEYGLARDCGWYLYRIQYPLKKSDSNRLQKELTGKPHAAISSDFLVLQLEAGKEQLFFEPAISTPVNCEPFSVPLKHPVNGREYRFYIGRCKKETYAGKIPKHFRQGMIFPEHYCVLVYAVVPELPAEEFFCVQDCASSDKPVREDNNKKGKMASAISIIGGSDGPTAIFLAGKLSDKEILLKDLENTVPEKNPEWRTACSALTFEPVSAITWKCSVQIAPYPARKIPLTDF